MKIIHFIIISLLLIITACSNEDKNNVLFDGYNLSSNQGLSVSMPIYSGRADSPEWFINNSTEILMIKEKLDSLPVLKDESNYKDSLGGFMIWNKGVDDFPLIIRVIGGAVLVSEFDDKPITTDVVIPTKRTYYKDNGYELEKMLCRMAKKEKSLEGKLPGYIVESELC